MRIAIGLLSFLFFNTTTYGEIFLGEVNSDEITEPATKDLDQVNNKSDESSQFSNLEHWDFTFGLGGNLNQYSGNFAAIYNFNAYVKSELRFNFISSVTEEESLETKSLDIPLIIILSNPTFVWPYIGAGPGYERWFKTNTIGVIDDTYSLTGFHLVGVKLRFSRHFSLNVEQKTTFYVNNSPVEKVINQGEYDEEKIYQKQIAQNLAVNFHLTF